MRGVKTNILKTYQPIKKKSLFSDRTEIIRFQEPDVKLPPQKDDAGREEPEEGEASQLHCDVADNRDVFRVLGAVLQHPGRQQVVERGPDT